MAAVVAGTPEEVDEWVDLAIPEYDIYTSDDTSIKEVARGNPAVVFLRDGNVIWKRTLSSVDVEDFMAPDIDLDPSELRLLDSRTVLLRRIWLYAVAMIFLAVISQMPKLLSRIGQKSRKLVEKRRSVIHGDKARREE